MSVTSSGRSSTRTTIRWHSGLLAVIELAISFSTVVFPALGGETMRPRWPFPMGATRSMIRGRMWLVWPSTSSRSRASGNSGVRSAKRGRSIGLLGIDPVDLEDADGGGELLLGAGGADGPAADVTLAQPRTCAPGWPTRRRPCRRGGTRSSAGTRNPRGGCRGCPRGPRARSRRPAAGRGGCHPGCGGAGNGPAGRRIRRPRRAAVGEPAVRELAVGALTGAVAALLAGAGVGCVGDFGDVGDHRGVELVGLEDRRDQLGLLQPVVIDFDLARHATQVVEPQLLQLGSCGHFG